MPHTKKASIEVDIPSTDADADVDVAALALLDELMQDVGTVQVPKAIPAEELPLLSEQDVDTFRGLLLERGRNPEIEQILEDDRRNHGDIRRRKLALSLRAPVITEAQPPTSGPAPVPVTVPVVTPAGAAPPGALPDMSAVGAAVTTVRKKDSRSLRKNLATLVGSLHPNATAKKFHSEVRNWIWAINSVMTERDEIAPCMRAQPGIGTFVKNAARDMSADQKRMLNDRKMFDLEYLHKQRWGKPKNKKWEHLLRSETFDPLVAATFVATVGTTDNLIDALGLQEPEQMQLGAIRSEKLRKRWITLEKEADRLEAQLKGVGPLRGSKVAKEAVPRWREEFIALSVARGSPGEASRLMPRLYGRAKAANQLANRKGHLRAKGFKVDFSSLT